MTAFFRRLRARLRYRHFTADLQRELEVHRAMAEDALRASGERPEDVHHQATRQLGNVTLARASARDVWIAPWLDSIRQDVRYAVRSLRQSPGFALTALATLMLGVGVNTTLFTLTNALLFRPWRAPDAHELVLAYHRMPRASGEMLVGVSAPELEFLREQATTVNIAGTRPVGGLLVDGATARAASGRLVSGNYFDVLDVPMAIGRGLQREDDQPGRAGVVVLGYDLWRSAFSSDTNIVGRTIRFRNVPVTVIGVAGPGVEESPLAGVPELWVPLWSMSALFPEETFAQEFMSNAAHCCVDLVGRLRPGLNRTRAEAELSVLDRQFRSDEPDGAGMRVTGTETFHTLEAGKMLAVFSLLLAGGSLVLLLTCANVGNLQLARAAARRREVTMRLALGATRRRVVRQLLTEGLVLATAAVSLCLIASSMVVRTVMARVDASVARSLDFTIDVRVLLFAAGLTVVTCLITSLAPALRGTRHLVTGRTSDRPTQRLRSTFLATQVALSVVLLIAAVLLGRGLAQAASQDVGFRLDTLMAIGVERPWQGPDDGRLFLYDVMAAVEDRPVAAAAAMPLGDYSFHTGVRRADEPYEADRPARYQPVSASYFDVLRIPLRSGRVFSDTASNEVVLNETLARMLWPDGEAVGGYLAGAGGTVGRQVVGVVADAHINGLGGIVPTIFHSGAFKSLGEPNEALTYLLFNEGEMTPDELRAVVAGVDRSATTTVQAVGDNVASSLEAATLGARIAGGLGLLALAIVAVGTAGVFSFAVGERTREIGIRLALGASQRRIRALLLRHAGRPIAAGVVVGLLLAALAGPALRGFLYGLSSSDPMAHIAVVLVVVLTAWTATLLPMRRALRVDPAITLRHE